MKKIILSACIIISALSLQAFEWPVKNVKPESFKSYFAQNRGNTISSSIVIQTLPEKEEEETFIPEVINSEDGKVLVILTDFKDDNDFFPSTLGQAVIVSHEDNIISVYGNLESSVENAMNSAPKISKGTNLGIIADSAWTETTKSLEFKIIDTKNQIAVNPRILLPRVEKEKSFAPVEIIVENKDGKRFDLNTNRSFLSGNYKFYQKRNDTLTPLKSSISVNGELCDELNFSEIFQKNNEIFVSSNSKKYTDSELYPDSKLLLIGEARIAKGKSVITFENTSLLEEKRLVNYAVNIY